MTTKERKQRWINRKIVQAENEYIALDDGTYIYLDSTEFDDDDE